MTFYYIEDENVLEGNNMFYEYDAGTVAEVDGTTLVIDVDFIMDEGRGMNKLKEMRDAIESAIQANKD